MFRKTRYNRVFQDLVQQIQEAIMDGRLKPGDRLPSQRELVDLFQTSRASIREALRVLEHKGLIEIKLGVSGGAVVKTPGTETISDVLTLLMQQQHVSFAHLAEFRRSIEGDMTALAAERATDDDRARLEDVLRQAEVCLGQAEPIPYEFIRTDIRMHIALAEASGNPVFIAITRMIHETILGFYDRFTFRRREVLEENYRDLIAIVAAVKAGDADAARQLALDHVGRFHRHLQAGSGTADRGRPQPKTVADV